MKPRTIASAPPITTALLLVLATGLAAAQEPAPHAPTQPKAPQPRPKLIQADAGYKKAWEHYNLGQHADALVAFTTIAQKTAAKPAQADLRRAALKDLVLPYAAVGDSKSAYKTFQRLDPAFAPTMLQALGDRYQDQGHYGHLIYAFRGAMATAPKHPRACQWHHRVAQSMIQAGSREQQVAEVTSLVHRATAARPRSSMSKALRDECMQSTAALTGELAKRIHKDAAQSRDPLLLTAAEVLYDLYLTRFPKQADHAEMQYFYAELMWSEAEQEKDIRMALAGWERAAIAFTSAAKSGKLPEEMHKEAAYAAVLAWRNALEVEPRPMAAKDSALTDLPAKPQPIPARERKLIDALDLYASTVKAPQQDELVQIKYLKARAFWRHGHLDTAMPLFADIIENHPGHETAEYAVDLLLDTLNLTGRHDELLTWVERLLENQALLKDREELAGRLRAIRVMGLRKSLEALEAQGKRTGDRTAYIECGLGYVALFNADVESPHADEHLYHASVCFLQGGAMGLALQTLRSLSTTFPDSPLARRALAMRAEASARVGWFAAAAEHEEQYARAYAGDKDAYAALTRAVSYRQALGETEKAVALLERFLRRARADQAEETADAMFRLIAIHDQHGKPGAALTYLRRYLADDSSRGGPERPDRIDRQMIAQAKLGMILWKQSCPVAGVDGACIRSPSGPAKASPRQSQRRQALAAPATCGPPSRRPAAVALRDPEKAREAQRALRAAVSLYEKAMTGGRPSGIQAQTAPTAAMREHYAAARLYLADAEFEAYLAMPLPSRLRTLLESPPSPSSPGAPEAAQALAKELAAWQEAKRGRAARVQEAYRAILALPFILEDPAAAHYASAAASRIGQIAHSHANALLGVPILARRATGTRDTDAMAAHCSRLAEAARPLERDAMAAYERCLSMATAHRWHTPFTRQCERALAELHPAAHPHPAERRPAPAQITPILAQEDPIIAPATRTP